MSPLKVLFIAGSRQSSSGRGNVALDGEFNAIKNSIKGSLHRDSITLLPPCFSATRADLVRYVTEADPAIVHFVGHGVDRHLRLLNSDGFPQDFSADDMVEVFKNMTNRSFLVVLNTCASLSVARRLVEVVDVAIGTDANLNDDVASQFSALFYEQIGNRLNGTLKPDLIKKAFNTALAGIENRPPESELPQLILKANPDIVLSMHPQTRGVWRDLGIASPDVDLDELHIDTPPATWHITEPTDSVHWEKAASQLDEQIQKLERRPWKRLHVLVSAPYSLGAILGNKLFQRFGRGHTIAVYQYNAISSKWENWGPARTEPISPKPEALLTPTWLVRAPASDGRAGGSISDVAVVISLTRQLVRDEIQTALGTLKDIPTLEAAPPCIGQDAIGDADMVERAVRDIGKLLAEAAGRYPGATIHFFYSGPVALLIRAAEKTHLLAAKIIIYERTCPDGSWRFSKGAGLRTNRLFLGPSKP